MTQNDSSANSGSNFNQIYTTDFPSNSGSDFKKNDFSIDSGGDLKK